MVGFMSLLRSFSVMILSTCGTPKVSVDLLFLNPVRDGMLIDRAPDPGILTLLGVACRFGFISLLRSSGGQFVSPTVDMSLLRSSRAPRLDDSISMTLLRSLGRMMFPTPAVPKVSVDLLLPNPVRDGMLIECAPHPGILTPLGVACRVGFMSLLPSSGASFASRNRPGCSDTC